MVRICSVLVMTGHRGSISARRTVTSSSRLKCRGESKEEKEEKGRKFHRVERYYGAFSRSFALPQNIDENHIEANFKDGLLTLQVPKTQAEKPKSIEEKIA